MWTARRADLQEKCLEASERCPNPEVDLLSGVHGLGVVLIWFDKIVDSML